MQLQRVQEPVLGEPHVIRAPILESVRESRVERHEAFVGAGEMHSCGACDLVV